MLLNKTAICYSSFSQLFSDKFCGAKAVDFCASVSGTRVICMHSDTLESSLRFYEQLFRRLIRNDIDEGRSPRLQFLVERSRNGADDGNIDDVESAMISDAMRLIVDEESDQVCVCTPPNSSFSSLSSLSFNNFGSVLGYRI